MKIQSITCIEDEFTEEEIKSAENYIRRTLKPIHKDIEADGGTIILLIKSDEVAYKLTGFSMLLEFKIKSLLKPGTTRKHAKEN